jgi:imidazolonepropionase-like amidohydrolase
MFFQENRAKDRLLLTDCVLADVTNMHVLRGVSVLIEGGVIRHVGNPLVINAPRISLAGKTLAPGMIDAHVHLCLSSLPDCHTTLDGLNAEQRMEIIRENLRRNLNAGVTSVRDLGSRMEMLADLRELERGGEHFPSVMASGPALTIKDGHATFIGVVADPSNSADLIRAAAAEGAEVVKIIGTGGNLSPSTDTQGCQFTDEEFSAIVAEARRAGLAVACHAHATAAVEQCLRFGVRSVEHGSYLLPDQLPHFISAGAYWVPTICPGRLIDNLSEAALDRVTRRRSNVRLAIEMGVAVAAGTDAGIGGVAHGALAHELDELMDAGMTALQALRSACLLNAIMMGIETYKGSLEEGKDADLLVFDGDIEAPGFSFHNPSLVIKGGVVVKSSLQHITTEP